MMTMPQFDMMDLLPAVIICLGAAFVWMFWQIEHRQDHRHKSHLRWHRLTMSQKDGARHGSRAGPGG
jgi:hypothetical protein